MPRRVNLAGFKRVNTTHYRNSTGRASRSTSPRPPRRLYGVFLIDCSGDSAVARSTQPFVVCVWAFLPLPCSHVHKRRVPHRPTLYLAPTFVENTDPCACARNRRREACRRQNCAGRRRQTCRPLSYTCSGRASTSSSASWSSARLERSPTPLLPPPLPPSQPSTTTAAKSP